MSISTHRLRLAPELAVEKTLRWESTKRFPLFHRHDGGDEMYRMISTEVC